MCGCCFAGARTEPDGATACAVHYVHSVHVTSLYSQSYSQSYILQSYIYVEPVGYEAQSTTDSHLLISRSGEIKKMSLPSYTVAAAGYLSHCHPGCIEVHTAVMTADCVARCDQSSSQGLLYGSGHSGKSGRVSGKSPCRCLLMPMYGVCAFCV